jgi:hypothetical protein
MRPEYTATDTARLWAKVTQTPTCWPRSGAQDKDGYTRLHAGGREIRAHRLAWELANGSVVPAGACVLHRCDNPPCVRPDHLFLGTKGDNNRDRHGKGRDAAGTRNGRSLHPERYPRGDAHPARVHPERLARGERSGAVLHPEQYRGERNSAAKVTADQVREIRALYAAGGITYKELGARYGLSITPTWMIVTRKSWAHIA